MYAKPAVSLSSLIFLISSWNECIFLLPCFSVHCLLPVNLIFFDKGKILFSFVTRINHELKRKKIRIVAILILIIESMESHDALENNGWNRNNYVLFDLKFSYGFLITTNKKDNCLADNDRRTLIWKEQCFVKKIFYHFISLSLCIIIELNRLISD